ncbi:MAG TPA: metallophosphoesterase, partial [Sphingomonas sp.]
MFARSAPLLAKAPAGLRIYAIGDVHGCADQLRSLIAAIEADHAARPPADLRLILLGDLVDRGPASAAVLDQVSALRHRYPTLRTLMGNHEEIMLKAVEGDKEAMRFFLRFGGTETLLSYGVDPGELERSDWDEAIALAQRAI